MRRQTTISQTAREKTGTYRGALVYRKETGYMSVTMMISLLARGEESRVIIHAFDVPAPEEPEHIPSYHPPIVGVDLYQFVVWAGSNIQLMINRPGQSTLEAWYTVLDTQIQEASGDIWLDVIQAEN